jgi:hypothetical protein
MLMANRLDERVEQALRRMSPAVDCDGAGIWRFPLANGTLLHARGHLTQGWLELTAQLPGDGFIGFNEEAALRLNTGLDGTVRVARPFGDHVPHVRAEVCVENLVDLDGWVQQAAAGLAEAAHHLTGPSEPRHEPAPFHLRSLEIPQLDVAPVDDVAQLCREAGWHVASGDGPGLRVEIPTRAGAYRSYLDMPVQRAARFVVELTELTGQPDICRRAVTAMLLAVSGAVRSVKGGLFDHGGRTVAALMAPIVSGCEAGVDDSLAALATACQVSGREVVALLDERLASDYLARSRLGRPTAFAEAPAVRKVAATYHEPKPAPMYTSEEESCLQ